MFKMFTKDTIIEKLNDLPNSGDVSNEWFENIYFLLCYFIWDYHFHNSIDENNNVIHGDYLHKYRDKIIVFLKNDTVYYNDLNLNILLECIKVMRYFIDKIRIEKITEKDEKIIKYNK